MDYYLNGALDPQYASYLTPDFLWGVVTKYSAILHPSGAFVFLDENEMTIEDGVYLLFRAPDETWQNAPSDRHNRGMNLTFADGHCEYWKWRVPKPMQSLAQGAQDDNDLQDLRRLQAALVNAQ